MLTVRVAAIVLIPMVNQYMAREIGCVFCWCGRALTVLVLVLVLFCAYTVRVAAVVLVLTVNLRELGAKLEDTAYQKEFHQKTERKESSRDWKFIS